MDLQHYFCITLTTLLVYRRIGKGMTEYICLDSDMYDSLFQYYQISGNSFSHDSKLDTKIWDMLDKQQYKLYIESYIASKDITYTNSYYSLLSPALQLDMKSPPIICFFPEEMALLSCSNGFSVQDTIRHTKFIMYRARRRLYQEVPTLSEFQYF